MSETGPWNPGIASTLPSALVPLTTLFRPEHIFESLDDLEELSSFCGVSREEVATFRPERLAVHELLIRVSADLVVSDGDEYEALGNNFRRIARRLYDGYIVSRLDEVSNQYDAIREEVNELISAEVARLESPTLPRTEPGLLSRLLFRKQRPQVDPVTPDSIIARWDADALDKHRDAMQRASLESLSYIAGRILIRHGRLPGDHGLLLKLATNRVMNSFGSESIGNLIGLWIKQGAEKEGYSRLPAQASPVVMNVKGASAAGKSTLRPLQKRLVERLGLSWRDFALVSPDIFRKYLLDYESLGDAYKYAGTLSGQELQVVDQKLDRHVADKARRGELTHLLIDRFRFDSFSPKSPEQGSNLLTRFGARVFLFFVVTPPHATVERAWRRGLQVGRFKAVDDLIDHNVEAFNGIPGLFFTWALDREKEVYYEFLDNSVAIGEQPRSIAFGENGGLTILDVDKMMDINRYQKLNVNATDPDGVYPDKTPGGSQNDVEFLRNCIERLPSVVFACFETGDVYARVASGRRVMFDSEVCARCNFDAGSRERLTTLVSSLPQAETLPSHSDSEATLDTLGARGKRAVLI